jgi:hypothetical protein
MNTFRLDGYSKHDISHALAPKQRSQTQEQKPAGTAMITYQQESSTKSPGFLQNTTLRQFTFL